MKRVLSLLPSTTEIMYALGAEDALVGVTHECDFPRGTASKPDVTSAEIHPELESQEIDRLVRQQLEDSGSLYGLDMDLVRELRPEIVLTQQLCTVCAVGFETVQKAMASLSEPPEVINIEPKNMNDVFKSIRDIAQLTQHEEAGAVLIDKLRSSLENIEKANGPRLLFLEWLIPPFSAGDWIPEIIEAAGALPVLANPGSHSRQLSWEKIEQAEFDVIVVSCCGLEVDRAIRDIGQSQELQWLLNKRNDPPLFLFDGNHFFSRPGPRLVESAQLLAKALNGESSDNLRASICKPFIYLQKREDIA
ncbi:MAG: ABC transporter substrate-binding protein [Chlorobi bacterium]|nr:ABC transporter substrate-binding protein [Chlorobiota bacterium]